MSIKSFIQILILILIFSIIGGVYYKYFKTNEKIVEEINALENDDQAQIRELENKISNLEVKNKELTDKIVKKNGELKNSILVSKTSKDVEKKVIEKKKLTVKNKIEKNEVTKNEIKNLVKDVEYISMDERGNRFYLLANSGKTNKNTTDILDLINVRGKITSDLRDTIYIVSDYAQYNSINLNSKFYENVIINYQDKKITCVNFDINMESNKAIAYNNVLITDPKSIMKAGMVEFDLETKDININPEVSSDKIEVITN